MCSNYGHFRFHRFGCIETGSREAETERNDMKCAEKCAVPKMLIINYLLIIFWWHWYKYVCVRALASIHTIYKHITWESVWLWVLCAYSPKDRLWCVCKDLGTYKDRQNIKINTWFQDTLPSDCSHCTWCSYTRIILSSIISSVKCDHFVLWFYFRKKNHQKKSNLILEHTVYLYISCAFAFWMNAYRFYIHFHFHSFPFRFDLRSILLWTCGICVQHIAYNYEHWLNQTDGMARLSWNKRKC